MWGKVCLLLLTSFLATGCVKLPSEPAAFISPVVHPATYRNLDEPPQLSKEEAESHWGQEYVLGKQFAEEQDFYRAITCFQRAKFLLPLPIDDDRMAQLFHAELLAYSLGGKYQEAISLWEKEADSLRIKDKDIAKDCICLLFESYCRLGQEQKAHDLLNALPMNEPLRKKLPLFEVIAKNSDESISTAHLFAHEVGIDEEVAAKELSSLYVNQRKSPATARILNGILPGAGYLYVQQYQTAATAFIFNALFIASTVQFFHADLAAAGCLCAGFEVGWYLGGITGAGLAADMYNVRLRELIAKPYLERFRLFPLRMVRYKC